MRWTLFGWIFLGLSICSLNFVLFQSYSIYSEIRFAERSDQIHETRGHPLSISTFGALGMPDMQDKLEDPKSRELPPTAGLPPPHELQDLPPGREGASIRYGMDLLVNTPSWIGPRGKLKSYTQSRMACRNCHLDSGYKPFGNSWLDSHGIYPQYRSREGKIQTLADRINTCLEHPMQGNPLPVAGYEMSSILLYFKWMGRDRIAWKKDMDQRLAPLPFMTRAADPEIGRQIYMGRCLQCHGTSGQGKLARDGGSYVFPPLWGHESYTMGSGMSRLSLLARFIKGNMPLGATAEQPLLTDEESWDVAAFVNSQSRPPWKGKAPFPAACEKPFDFPIGPYDDPFSFDQHKLGPFSPIIEYWNREREGSAVTDSAGV